MVGLFRLDAALTVKQAALFRCDTAGNIEREGKIVSNHDVFEKERVSIFFISVKRYA